MKRWLFRLIVFYQAFYLSCNNSSNHNNSRLPGNKETVTRVIQDTSKDSPIIRAVNLGKIHAADSIRGFWRYKIFLSYSFSIGKDSVYYPDIGKMFAFQLYDSCITINHGNFIDTISYRLKGHDTLVFIKKDTQIYYRTNIMDYSGKVVHGKALLAISPVCYYFNSLLHSTAGSQLSCQGYGCFYQIGYVPLWDAWITEGAVDGDGTNIVPVFKDEDSGSDNNDYADFLYRCDMVVNVHGDILELEANRNAPSSALHASLEAKIYFSSHRKPIIGVQTSQEGRYSPEQGSINFYYMDDNRWEDITDGVIQIPNLQEFFEEPIDTNLANKYDYVHISTRFGENNDSLTLQAFLNDEFDFDPPVSDQEISDNDKKKLQSMSGDHFRNIIFLFNKNIIKFRKIGWANKM